MNSWGLRFDALTIILTGAVTVAAVVGQQYAACAKTAQENCPASDINNGGSQQYAGFFLLVALE